ncbi:transcription factor HES-5-like [Stegastes partitus]|nr:PREDICTED: transcription factor HES-5-like [Stegastes partitus]
MSQKDIKVRKPLVEKLRRDRINSCIEQLKVILEKEFHKQEPNSKLEKADILEMTVNFLRQQLQSGLCQSDYNQGYSHCWRDSVAPLQGLQQHDQRSSSSIRRSTTLQDSRDAVWRPW